MRISVRATRVNKWLASAAVAAATTTTLGVAAAPASGAGLNLLASKTTLSSVMAPDGGSLALTVTVANTVVPTGLGVSPTGTVTFTDDAGDHLGTAAVPSCLLTTCTLHRTVTVGQFSNKVTKLTAIYSGDLILSPSSASSSLLYERCTTANWCQASLTSGVTGVSASVPLNDAALITLGGASTPCSVGAGAVVNLAVSGTGRPMVLALAHTGAALTKYQAVDASTAVAAAHTNYRCDVSTNTYRGFSPGAAAFARSLSDFTQYGTLPQVTSGAYKGLYAGLIPDCTYWVAHAPTSNAVCNTVQATPPAGSDLVYIYFSPTTGVSHIAG